MSLSTKEIEKILMEDADDDDDVFQDRFSSDLEDFSGSDDSEYVEESSSDESDSDLESPAITRKIRPIRKPNQSVAVPQVYQHGWINVPQEPPNFEFQGNQGLKISLQELSPKCFADLFFNDNFMKSLVDETNRYAAQEIAKSGAIRRSSRLKRWYECDVTEMKVFLGLLFHMGPFSLPTIEHYWNSSAFYNVPFWRSIMSRNRFQILLRFLHYADNNDPAASTDRLHKIRPVLNHINNTMNTIYSPGKKLCIDESMVLWRGRLMFRQYIKSKRHKYGIKLYELCESNGNVLKIQIYCGNQKIHPAK